MTSSYNHNILGTAEKPLIPNIEFKKLMELRRKGEVKECEKILEKYSLEFYQKQVYDRATNNDLNTSLI